MPKWMDCICHEMKKKDNKVNVCFLTSSKVYCGKFRKEKEFASLDKDLFIRKPIQNEDLVG
jgi:hypothetical protein